YKSRARTAGRFAIRFAKSDQAWEYLLRWLPSRRRDMPKTTREVSRALMAPTWLQLQSASSAKSATKRLEDLLFASACDELVGNAFDMTIPYFIAIAFLTLSIIERFGICDVDLSISAS